MKPDRLLPGAVLLHAAATLTHFAHNAEFLGAYPNMPEWISRGGVYLTWLAIAAIGLVGYVLLRLGHRTTGLIVLAAYALLGFGGLDHYTLAAISAHTLTMNLTIAMEALTATALLTTVLVAFRPSARAGTGC